MGTNYYLHTGDCKCCGHSGEVLHIGKSSAGWHFLLHVHPDKKIHDLADWEPKFNAGGVIMDEHGDVIEPKQMMDIIIGRSKTVSWWEVPQGWESWESFHLANQSERGLHGLIAHRYKAKRTYGTYDITEIDFS
jgi:hypothetical protein